MGGKAHVLNLKNIIWPIAIYISWNKFGIVTVQKINTTNWCFVAK